MEDDPGIDKSHTLDTDDVAHPVIYASGRRLSHGRKKTSSRGMRRLINLDRRLSRALRRFTRAMNHGMDAYIDHRDLSRDRRKDGPAVDFVVNVSYGVSKAVSEASPVITDIAKAWNTRRMRRQIRRFARTFPRIPFLV